MPELGATGLGGFFNIAAMVTNNKMSADMASTSRLENYLYNERSAEAAYQRQKEMMETYFTPSAQIQQLQEAGLSPSLMYGKSGATQGASAPQGAGPQGPQSQFTPLNPMVGAQIAEMLSQAKLNKAKADELNGDNQRGQTEIAKLLAEINNINADTALKDSANTLNDIEIWIKDQVKDATVQELQDKATLVWQNLQNAIVTGETIQLDKRYQEETFNARVTAQNLANRNLLYDTMQKKANIQLTEAQKAKINKECELLDKQYTLECYKAKTDKERNEIQDRYNKAVVKVMRDNCTDQIDYERDKMWLDAGVEIYTGMVQNGIKLIDAVIPG